MVAVKPRLWSVALCLVLAGVAGCGQAPDSKSSPVEASQTPSAKVINYGKHGVVLHRASDARKLTGAPDDFKQFIAGVTQATTSGIDPSDDCKPQVEVLIVDPKGYAAGAMRGCDGAAYMWAKKKGVWQQIWAGQYAPDCDFLKAQAVPTSIAGNECWQDKRMVPYAG